MTEQLALLALDSPEEVPEVGVVEVVDPRGVVVRFRLNQWWRRHVRYRHPSVAGLPLETITDIVAHPDAVVTEVRATYWAARANLTSGGLAVVTTMDVDGSRSLLTAFPRGPERRWRGDVELYTR